MSRTTLIVLVALAGCGDDPLDDVTRPPPAPDTGRIVGRLCDLDTGAWLGGVEVTLRGEDRSARTDLNGTFAFDDVLPGSYTLDFDTAALPSREVAVSAGETTEVGDNQCVDPRGSLTGRACDLEHGVTLANATITLDDATSTTTTAAGDGTFTFTGVAPGSYQITIVAGSFNVTRSASVHSGVTTDIGPEACAGRVVGNLCIGDYWLGGATVTITLGDGTEISTLTATGGQYALENVPAGHHRVRGEKNSFSVTSEEIEVTLGNTTLVPDQCLRPDVRIAVVTGLFDRSQNVLADLGLPTRDHYWSTSAVDRINPAGVVDLIHGEPAAIPNSTWPADEPSKLWLNGFLADLEWMRDYDIIYFNCGLNIAPFWEASPPAYVGQAMSNLEQWVSEGGSLYVSDWAAAVLYAAFPGELAFRPEQEAFGRGAIAPAIQVTVTDAGLRNALGGVNTLPLAFDEAYWVVMAQTQPLAVNVMMEATVGYYTTGTPMEILVQADTPVLVHVDHGEGRILFTSMHIEVGHTPQPALPEVLEYVVFEL